MPLPVRQPEAMLGRNGQDSMAIPEIRFHIVAASSRPIAPSDIWSG